MSAKGSTFRLSEEAKQKISEARRRRKETLGHINTPETKLRMSQAAKLRKASPETRAKISQAKQGKKPKNFAVFLAKAHAVPKPSGEDHPFWKGDSVGYEALHAWVRRQLGTPSKCSRCKTTEAKRYEWANVSGEYKRDITDWLRLCVSCHRKEGFARGEYTPWNKGKHYQCNTGRTHIRKGQRISPHTEFKKGMTSWRKYLAPRPCKKCKADFQPREDTRSYCSRVCYWLSLRKET